MGIWLNNKIIIQCICLFKQRALKTIKTIVNLTEATILLRALKLIAKNLKNMFNGN